MSHDIRLVVFDFDGVMIDFEPALRQAVFVDDGYQFIQGAISAGMHGIHFQNLPALRVALEPMLSSLSLYTAT